MVVPQLLDDDGRAEGPPAEMVAAIAENREDNVENEQQQQQDRHAHDELELLLTLVRAVSPPDVDPRMVLSAEERGWALAIKVAAKETPGIDALSDYECAQYALIDRGILQASLIRAQHLQVFREEYSLRDTLEEGMQICRSMINLYPKFLLSISFCETEGYVAVFDVAALVQERLKSDDNYRTMLGFLYFCGQFVSPDFETIRNGTVIICEAEGFDAKTNLSPSTHRRLWTEIISVYPMNVKAIQYFHTGVFANVHISLLKKFMPLDLAAKIQTGLQFPGRLDTYYFVPTREAAHGRILGQLDSMLKLRYANVESFRL